MATEAAGASRNRGSLWLRFELLVLRSAVTRCSPSTEVSQFVRRFADIRNFTHLLLSGPVVGTNYASRVLLVEDHALVRAGFRRIIEESEDFEVSGEAGDGRQAVGLAMETAPDLVVMDVSLPLLSGVEATRRIKQSLPDCGVLMLSQHESLRFIEASFRCGASGYLSKTAEPDEFLLALREVRQGKRAISHDLAPRVVSALTGDLDRRATVLAKLTAREREILQLVAEGLSTKEIARDLNISPRTAETHRANLMRKLSTNSTARLVRLAVREGLISA